MSYHKPIKVPSTFINDATEMDLIQLSPMRRPYQNEQNCGNTIANNQASRTNFIGNSPLPSDRSRAFAITNTGEKVPVDPDESLVPKTNLNPFAIRSPRLSTPTMEKISEKSSTSLPLAEKSSKKHCTKKPLKRYKYRLLCTPRNMETTSSSRVLLPKSPKSDKLELKVHQHTCAETQTEHNAELTSRGCDLPKPYEKLRTANATKNNYMPRENARTRYENPKQDFIMQPRFYNAVAAIPPPMEPLKIYTKNDYNLSRYSELRSLASALTLITVLSWLFSTFFDVECLWNYLNNCWQYFCNWLLPQERPKTKVEIFITFLQDMWS